MKKKWTTTLAAVLATVMLVTASVPALAESHQEREKPVRERPVRERQVSSNKTAVRERPVEVRQALAIEAPRRAGPGETVTMTVTERSSEEAVKDAAVWALTRENIEALQAEIANSRQSTATEDTDTPPVRVNFEDVVGVYGTFLGSTNGAGMLKYAFEEEGFYMLVALKPGYSPGRTGIAIKGIPQALVIEAPRRADPGDTVTMTVTERDGESGVKDAAVWALTRENAEALRAEVEKIKAAGANGTQSIDHEALVIRYGFLLGNTNGSGMLKYAFEEEGFYALVALKAGYRPGHTGIAIKSKPQALAIQSPRKAELGEEVTLTIVQRGSETPVEGSAVWALKLDLDSLEYVPSTLLGYSDENGQLQYSFSEEGFYLLLANKTGYLPGLSPIMIGTVNVPGVTPEVQTADTH